MCPVFGSPDGRGPGGRRDERVSASARATNRTGGRQAADTEVQTKRDRAGALSVCAGVDLSAKEQPARCRDPVVVCERKLHRRDARCTAVASWISGEGPNRQYRLAVQAVMGRGLRAWRKERRDHDR